MFEYSAEVKRVVDGDTYDLVVDLGFNIKHTIRVRLDGIDTPELFRPRNSAERSHAVEAAEFASNQVLSRSVILRTKKDKTGKYGRYIASIHYGRNFEYDLTQELISNGFSKRGEYL